MNLKSLTNLIIASLVLAIVAFICSIPDLAVNWSYYGLTIPDSLNQLYQSPYFMQIISSLSSVAIFIMIILLGVIFHYSKNMIMGSQ
jgi:uncharacterized membrane protein